MRPSLASRPPHRGCFGASRRDSLSRTDSSSSLVLQLVSSPTKVARFGLDNDGRRIGRSQDTTKVACRCQHRQRQGQDDGCARRAVPRVGARAQRLHAAVHQVHDQQLRREPGGEEDRHRDHLARRRLHLAVEGHREGQGARARPVGAVQGTRSPPATTTSSPSTSSRIRSPTAGCRSTR